MLLDWTLGACLGRGLRSSVLRRIPVWISAPLRYYCSLGTEDYGAGDGVACGHWAVTWGLFIDRLGLLEMRAPYFSFALSETLEMETAGSGSHLKISKIGRLDLRQAPCFFPSD